VLKAAEAGVWVFKTGFRAGSRTDREADLAVVAAKLAGAEGHQPGAKHDALL